MSSPAPVGRRDRKKAETHEALRWAALRLALEHGYEQLTVEAITEAADVSVRTFFNYFSSKDDALFAPDPDGAEALAAELAARPTSEPPVAALRAVFGQLAESFVAHEPMWQARMELVRANPQLWPRLFAGFRAFERSNALNPANILGQSCGLARTSSNRACHIGSCATNDSASCPNTARSAATGGSLVGRAASSAANASAPSGSGANSASSLEVK